MMNKKLSVLIVDDHESFVRRMVGLLDEVENISSIQTAHNYNDASTMVRSEKPDVILLDISLPGKSGIDFLHLIKEQSIECKIIMLSNLSATYYKQECQKLGASYFLDKTNEFELVPAIITSFYLN